jgi:hypothetical protein
LKPVITCAFLAVLCFETQALAQDLSAVQHVAKNFSRIQELIDQHRSVIIRQANDQMMGNLPIPQDVSGEAAKASQDAESWGCEMKITERPATDIKFGDQTMNVVPFTITYEGKACPVQLSATMDVVPVGNQPNSFRILTKIDFKVDPSKVDQFGFSEATGSQDALVNIVADPKGMSMEVGITTALDSNGGPEGHVHGEQGLDFKFGFAPPLNISAASEDFGKFTIKGQTTTLRRKISLAGLAASAEYFVNDAKSDQKTYETSMQGLHYFGLNEVKATGSGSLLSCAGSFVETKAVTALEEPEFKKSGKFPTAPPAFSWKACGVGSSQTFEPYKIENKFDTNWLELSIQGPKNPLQFFILYGEDSHLIGREDSYSVFVSCQAVAKCVGGN